MSNNPDSNEHHKDCIDCELEDALTALLIGRGVSKRRARSVAQDVLTLVRGRTIGDDD